MRAPFHVDRRFVLLFFFCAAQISFACDPSPAGLPLWIRLSNPISTYTAKPGDPVHAVLTQDLVCDEEVVLPMGAAVDGVVRSRRKVGWGIRHETAALDLEFRSASGKSGETIPLVARVEEVANARETVRNGVIQGIRSSNTFQGRINSRLIHLPTWNPYSDPVLVIYKAVFPIFPEPEIYYPAGTDIRLRMKSELLPSANAETDSAEPVAEIASLPMPMFPMREVSLDSATQPEQLDQLVDQMPLRVTTTKDIEADLLNVVFLGSKEDVNSAFRHAGWNSADPASRWSALKSMYALLNNSGYHQQPMMTFLLDGKPQDMSWQKSLNSYDRRDHLRIWRWTPNGSTQSVWVSSSTHDTSAVLAVKYRGFVHHIAPDIDDERETVVRDLNFAGCVRSVSYISRSDMPLSTHNATGDVMRTDGSVAVVRLQECRATVTQADSRSQINFKAGNHTFRFFRRQILTFKNDIFRANIIYGAYDGGRMLVGALRKRSGGVTP